MVHVIDLNFHVSEAIAVFVIESSEGLILIESGPHSTMPYLEKGLSELGYSLSQVSHVLLTHIHFDHAGAAWALAKEGAKVFVHPVGYPHLLDPGKLYNSAKRIYGDMMESLWGLMEGIPEEQLQVVEDASTLNIGEHSFLALHTPGHANHHIAWQWEDIIFCGDVGGVRVPGGPVVPPCPPPDINLEAWRKSIERILEQNPTQLYLTHYGSVDEPASHMEKLRNIMDDWANWIKPYWEAGKKPNEVVPEFRQYAEQQLRDAGLDDMGVSRYEAANPAWMSVAGLMRYWRKKSEGALEV